MLRLQLIIMFENHMKQKFQETQKNTLENKLKKRCYKNIKLCDETIADNTF